MKGTLELLCGPSGVGKSSKMRPKEKAFTYTTRPMRESEIQGKDRNFVNNQTFSELFKNGEIVFSYEYDGHKYGFSKSLINELHKGNSISEQIGPCEQAIKAGELFKKHGNVIKRLFLCNMDDVALRLNENREPAESKRRTELSFYETRRYLDNIMQFDHFHYNFPTRLVESKAKILFEATKRIKDSDPFTIALAHGRILLNDDYQGALMTLNPFIYNQIVNTAIMLLTGREKSKGYLIAGRGLDDNVFHDAIGLASLQLEFGMGDEAINGLMKMNKIMRLQGLGEAIQGQDPILKSTAANILNYYHPDNFQFALHATNLVRDSNEKNLAALFFIPLLNDIHTYNIYFDYILNVSKKIPAIKFNAPLSLSQMFTLMLQGVYAHNYSDYLRQDGESMKKRIGNDLEKIMSSISRIEPVSIPNKTEFSKYLIDSFNFSTFLASSINYFLWDYSISYPDVDNHRKMASTIAHSTSTITASQETLVLKYLANSVNHLLTNMATINMFNNAIAPNKFIYVGPAMDLDTLDNIIKKNLEQIPCMSESREFIEHITK